MWCLLVVGVAADIHAAVSEDSPLMIREALDAGESVNEIGQGGQTPLMAAVLQGKVNAVEALLSAGADATIGEGDGYTPMHGAGFQGRGEVAKLLIVHGLDPSDFHSDGFAPLHRACWGGEKRHTDMVRVLLEAGVPHDLPAKDGKHPGSMVRQRAYNPATLCIHPATLCTACNHM